MIKPFLLSLACLTSNVLATPTFDITYKVPEKKPAYTPRVYVVISKGFGEPRKNIGNWFQLPTLVAIDDTDGDGKVTIDEKVFASQPLAELDGEYKVQAVVRINPDWPIPGVAEGDLFSQHTLVEFKPGEDKTIMLKADEVVPAPTLRTEGRVQDHTFQSKLLSQFHERPYHINYSIILPEGWDKTKTYPVLVYTLGFGGDNIQHAKHVKRMLGEKADSMIVVIPDANCRWGHSVFADSIVNGPWGRATTEEFLPFIDKTYGGVGASQRFVTGVSSGGFSTIWLMVNYPDSFAGGWAVAPDPVDFRAFQELNICDDKPDNLFLNPDGSDRTLSIKQLGMKYKAFADYERVLGPGGQLKSFAGVFTKKRMENGGPEMWYDEKTGEIDQKICDSWAPYDISKIITKNWKNLGPKLTGKLHFGVHKTDAFHLNHAIKLIEEKCKQLGSDATFTYYEGMGHNMTDEHNQEMLDTILKQWEAHKPAKAGGK